MIRRAAAVALLLAGLARAEDEAFDRDLASAKAFADLLGRIGEPDGSRIVQLSPSPGGSALAKKFPSCGVMLPGVLLRKAENVGTVLFDDGVTRQVTLAGENWGGIPSNHHRDFVARIVPLPMGGLTVWALDAHRYRGDFGSERGAWRLAHWAAWLALRGENDEAVRSWRAAVDVLDRVPNATPAATPEERLLLAGSQAVADLDVGRLAEDEEVERVFDVAEHMLSEVKDAVVSARILGVMNGLKARHSEAARRIAEKRAEEARLREWIGRWSDFPPSGVEALSRADQSELWIRRLLDWNDRNLRDGLQGAFLQSLEKPGDFPCNRLFALGMDALPALVAGSLQSWPTPTTEHGRRVTVGDACALLLQQITGSGPLPLSPDSIWPGAGLADEERSRLVRDWWATLGPLPPGARWFTLRKSGSRRATRELLAIDARMYLPDFVAELDLLTGRRRAVERLFLVEQLRSLPPSSIENVPDACRDLVEEALNPSGTSSTPGEKAR